MSKNMPPDSKQLAIAKAVQEACIQAAKEGFNEASVSGLCTEGAMEAAIGAIQSMDVEAILAEAIQTNR